MRTRLGWVVVLSVVALFAEVAPVLGQEAARPADRSARSASELPASPSAPPSSRPPEVPTVGEFFDGPGGFPIEEVRDPEAPVGPEDVSLRSASGQVFDNADGTRTIRLYDTPRFFERDGAFVPIDNDVVPLAGAPGVLTNAANDWSVTFAPLDEGGVTVTHDGESLSFAPADGSPAKPVVGKDANVVVYEDVWPGVDVRYTVESNRLKEDLILSDPSRSSFAFAIAGAELEQAAGAPDGALMSRGVPIDQTPFRSGETAAARSQGDETAATIVIAPPEVIDSRGAPIDAARPTQTAEIAGVDRSLVTVAVDETWLRGLPHEAFPVVVDPTVIPGMGASWWESYKSDGWWCGPGVCGARVGNSLSGPGGSATYYRSAVEFDYEPYLTELWGSRALSAVVQAHVDVGASINTTTSVYAGQAWDYNSAVPNCVDGFCGASGTIGGQGSNLWLNVTTLYDYWLRTDTPPSPSTGFLFFRGDENPSVYTYKSLSVFLDLTVNRLAPAPTVVSPAPEATVSTYTPTLAATSVSDLDGDAVSYYFHLATTASMTGWAWNSGWVPSTSVAVPAGVLQEGRTYYWQVHSYDGTSCCFASAVHSFRVSHRLGADSTQPFDTIGPVSVNTANGNVVISAAGPSVSTVSGPASVGFTYNSRQPAVQGLVGAYYRDLNTNAVFDDGEAWIVRTDPSVAFNWGSGSPTPQMQTDNYLARWDGNLTAPVSGSYQFGVNTDDAMRVQVNGSWLVGSASTWSVFGSSWGGSVSLSAGQVVPIHVEYVEFSGSSSATLMVQGAVSTQPVPAAWLTPSVKTLPDGWSLSGAGGAGFDWQRANTPSTNANVVLVDPTGVTTEYRWNGTGYTAPSGEDGVLTRNSDGSLTLQESDGVEYLFDANGNLAQVNSGVDDRQPAALRHTWLGTPPRLDAVRDPVSNRDAITFRYGGHASCPTGAPAGFDAAAPPGMICQITYWDGTSTKLWYTSGRLGRIENPGAEVTDFSYDGSNRVTKVRTPLAADAVAAAVRADDDTTRTVIAYDGSNRASSVTLPAATAGAYRMLHSYAYVSSTSTHITTNATGSDSYFAYGASSDVALSGDWDGDGDDTIGVFSPSVAYFYLRNTNSAGSPNVSVNYGTSTYVPVVGDWDGDGDDTIGVWDPATVTFHLRNTNSAGSPNISVAYGTSSDVPVVGDWDGNGTTTLGVYRPSTATFYLRNSNTPGVADYTIPHGNVGDIPIVGDWDTDGDDSIGIYRPSTGTWYLLDGLAAGHSDHVFNAMPSPGTPEVGDWDGDGSSSIGGYWGAGNWVQYAPTTTVSTVTFDNTGRVLTATDPTGRTTTTTWDGVIDRPLYVDDAAAMRSSTVYSVEGRVTDTYGPAPASCFAGQTPNGTCTTPPVPRTHTDFDQNITSLAGVWWTNTTTAGAPVIHSTGVPDPVTNATIAGGTINHTWGAAAPSTELPADGWSVRFTGDITFPVTGAYAFAFWINGGLRVYIDDVKVHDAWSDSGTDTNPVFYYTATDTAQHRFRLEYADTTGPARLEMWWFRPDIGWQVTPAANLRPRYGLPTTTTTYESNGLPNEVTATGYASPESSLATLSMADPGGLNLMTFTGYETAGAGFRRRTSRTLPAGAATQVSYAYYGNTEARTNPCPGGLSAHQAGLAKTTTQADPDGGGGQTPLVREQVHDAAGRIVATRIGTEPWTCTTYDTRGRPLTIAYPAYGGAAARTVTMNYAVGGNPLVTSVNDSAGTITTTVDLLGRVVSYTDVWNKTTTTTYDRAGRATSSTGPSGTLAVRYDPAGRALQQWLDGSRVATAGYDGWGRLLATTYSNGTSLAALSPGTGYDSLGRLRKLQWNLNGSTVTDEVWRSQTGRVYDQAIDGVDPFAGGSNFVYDGAGRLVQARASGHHYTYAFSIANGCGLATTGANTNRTSWTDNGVTQATYCYDNADRLTSTTAAGLGTIAYDSHGNTTTLGSETHLYDAADRHRATTAGATTVSYGRDATDRIVARSDAAGTIKYSYSATGDTGDAVLDNAGSVIQRTIPLLGGVLLTAQTTGNVWSYPNVHGDVIATTSNSGVKQGATVHYDPYGNPIAGSVPDNSSDDLDYGWLGEHQRPLEHDGSLQPVIEMGARQYHPALGRFLHLDPIEGGSCSDYDYVCADPANNEDLTGEYCMTGVARRERYVAKYWITRNRSTGKITRRSVYQTREICRSLSRGAGRVARATLRGADWALRTAGNCLNGFATYGPPAELGAGALLALLPRLGARLNPYVAGAAFAVGCWTGIHSPAGFGPYGY